MYSSEEIKKFVEELKLSEDNDNGNSDRTDEMSPFIGLKISKNLDETQDDFFQQDLEGINKYCYIYNKQTNSYYFKAESWLAKIIFKKFKIIKDPLKLINNLYEITYENLITHEEVVLEKLTRNELIRHFCEESCVFYENKDKVSSFLNLFISCAGELIERTTEISLAGYFMLEDKVVCNDNLQENISENEGKEKLREAILFLNEIMSTRSSEGKRNDAAMYRFMLYSPFSYCLKQIGYEHSDFGMILSGTTQTNKSGSFFIGSKFYNNHRLNTSGDTLSAVGSRLEEGTFPTLLDECDHLFSNRDFINLMKKVIWDKESRGVKNKYNNRKIDYFHALSMPVFLMNPNQTYPKEVEERYKILRYTKQSYLAPAQKKEFNSKYLPTAADSPCNILQWIGLFFAGYFIGALENKDVHQVCFKDIDSFITNCLIKLEQDSGVEFLPEMKELTMTDQDYIYDLHDDIRRKLNTCFNKHARLHADNDMSMSILRNIINRESDFDFILYHRGSKTFTYQEFFVLSSGFVKFVKSLIPEVAVDLSECLVATHLDEILLEHKNNVGDDETILNFSKKVCSINLGKKIVKKRGFFLSAEELANNIFGLNVDFSEDNYFMEE